MSKKLVFLIAGLLALSFFWFVDDKYRGWDDTNQYQLEARAWAEGSRPPVKEILANTSGLIYQFSHHGPVLTPFIWSFLVKKDDWRASLWRIKFFQAILIAISLLLLVKYLGADFSALTIAVFFFANEFFREAVTTPVTEPLTMFLMIAAFVFSGAAGIWCILQFLNRTPVGILQTSQVWNSQKKIKQILMFVFCAVISVLYFGGLVRGTKVVFYGPSQWPNVLSGLADGLINFTKLLPMHNAQLVSITTWVVSGFLLLMLYSVRKKKILFLSMITYTVVILSVVPQGYRYFLPLILIWILEKKPKISQKKWIRILCGLFVLHFSFQQIENIRSFLRYPIPETESHGLQSTKDWINEKHIDNVMMLKVRYCINYFRIQCYTTPDNLSKESLIKEIKEHGVNYVIFSGVPWFTTEANVETTLNDLFKDKKLDMVKFQRKFDYVKVVDVRNL